MDQPNVEHDQKSQSARLREAYKNTFGTPDGRLVLNDLVKISKFFEETTVTGDSHMTYYNNGRRNIVTNILKRVFGRQEEILKYRKQTTASE